MTTNFNVRKATQLLNFVAQKSGGVVNKMKAIKIAFFADRYHLRKFCRTISGDKLVAMKLGPVGSGTRNILEQHPKYLSEEARGYASSFLAQDGSNRHFFVSLQPTDETVFSSSELEALYFAWNQFGHRAHFDLSEETHIYPEWKKFEQLLLQDPSNVFDIDIEDLFNDPGGVADPCYRLTPEEKTDHLAYFREQQKIEALWR
jgi:uncharacterized phage-associated protein